MEAPAKRSDRGPSVARAGSVVIGVDVGGTKILGVTVADGEIIDRELVPSTDGASTVVDQIYTVVAELVARASVNPGIAAPSGIGLGIAGFVGLDGVAVTAPNTKGLEGVDLAALLTGQHGIPVTVNNDANCVAIAAMNGADVEGGLVAITLGTGVGSGLVVNGSLLRGHHGFAGEPGHMVVDPSGPPCPCGGTGCWERFASGTGLAWLARRAVERGDASSILDAAGSVDAIVGRTVTDLLVAGDREAAEVFDEFIFYLALGTANLIMLLDPARVVLGGGLTALGDRLLIPLRQCIADRFPAAVQSRSTEIVIADLGEEAGAWGAALLAS